MIIFLNTQKENTAADKFFKALIGKCDNKFLLIKENKKGLFSFFKISLKLINLTKNKETNYKLIADCGCLKLFLLFFISNLYSKKIIVYTTFYHHIFNFKECILYNQMNESWKFISLKLYKYFLAKRKNFSINFLTVSEFTKKNLYKNFSISKSNIYVVWNQIFDTKLLKFEESNQIKYSNKSKIEPSILVISSLIKRKNIKIITDLAFIYKDRFKLVCPYTVNKKHISIINNLRKQKVKIFHNLKEKELLFLYQNVNCVLVPSLYEGLSLVPIEAIFNSVPLILSNIDPHKYWDLPKNFYFEVDSVDDLIEKINFYLSNVKQIVDYSKNPRLMSNLKKASIERTNNLNRIFDGNSV